MPLPQFVDCKGKVMQTNNYDVGLLKFCTISKMSFTKKDKKNCTNIALL